MRPSRRLNISATTRKIQVDHRFPIKKYFRTADNLLRQANVYREEGNIIELYVLLLRFSSLVGETIPEHLDYNTISSKEKTAYKQKFASILTELENLKPVVQIQVDKLNNATYRTIAVESSDDRHYEWPPISTAQTKRFITEKSGLESQRNLYPNRVQPNSFTQKLIVTSEETRLKHSVLGPDGLRPRWIPPVSQVKIVYPSQDAAMDVSSLEQSWDSILCSSEVSKISEVEAQPDSKQEAEDSIGDNVCEVKLIRQPSPPPVVVPVQDMPVMADLMQLCDTGHSLKTSAEADPVKTLPSPTKHFKQIEAPKELQIPAKMMEEFMKFAQRNTDKSIETCGVLAGSLKNSIFYITALIIPKQQGTTNTCQTTDEEEIFDWQDKRGLFQLGWIHTHPTQSCFMSSVDLHTHYSYQVMLPEAVAIVMAPTDRRKYGIFRLSDPGGIETIQKCSLRGFHPHDTPSDGKPIYETCPHVCLSEGLKYEVVDLR